MRRSRSFNSLLDIGEAQNFRFLTLRDYFTHLRSSSQISIDPGHRSDMQKYRSAKSPKHERQLYELTCDQKTKHVALSGVVLMSYVKRFQVSTSKLLVPDYRLCLKLSSGWKSRFQDRTYLKYRGVGSANTAAISHALLKLQKVLAQFADINI